MVKDGSSGDLIYVLLKGEGAVKDDSEVVTLWGGELSMVRQKLLDV